MSEMTYELNQMHERAAVTECLAAVTITNENGRHVPTVIIVPDSLAEAQQEKVREHLWDIAEILRNAHAANAELSGAGTASAGTNCYAPPNKETKMKAANFAQANKTLTPPGKTYSENVTGVEPLRVWTDGEQCVSCWRMTWRERIAALVHGRIWVSVLTGGTQPPMYAESARTYFRGA